MLDKCVIVCKPKTESVSKISSVSCVASLPTKKWKEQTTKDAIEPTKRKSSPSMF